MSDDRRPADSYDVAILGGGLAGLTLGLQLKQERPETSIFIAEKRDGPGARGRLQGRRVDPGDLLPLLRRGARADGPPGAGADPQVRAALLVPGGRQQRPRTARRARPAQASARAQLPARPRPLRELPRPSKCVEAGVDLFRGRFVQDVELGDDRHEVTSTTRDGDDERRSRPAGSSTRAVAPSSLKKKLGLLEDNGHVVNSSWFRLAGGLDIEDWADPSDEEFFGRMEERGLRMLSTNHICGAGLLGLADPALVGADLDRHRRRSALPPLGARSNTLEGALEWIKRARAPARRRRSRAGATRSRTSSRSRTSRTAASRPSTAASAGASSARRGRSSTRSTHRARTTSRWRTRSRPT